MLSKRDAERVRKSYEAHPGNSSPVCERCPAYCCRSDIAMTYVEAVLIVDRLKQEKRFDDVLSKEGSSRCSLLDGNICNVYGDRPVICRHFGAGAFTPLEPSYGRSRDAECRFVETI